MGRIKCRRPYGDPVILDYLKGINKKACDPISVRLH